MATPRSGYYIDGKRVPSVTTIIGTGLAGYSKDALMYWAWDQGKQGLDYRETRDKAASTGTLAHSLIEAHLRVEPFVIDPEPPDDVLQEAYAAFGAFLEWQDQHEIVIHEQEVQLVSEKYRYGGTFDALGSIDGVPCLFDWKSSKEIYSSYPVQLAAYFNLIYENRPLNLRPQLALIVRIGKDGSLRVVRLTTNDLAVGWDVFKHALAIYEAKRDLDAMVAKPKAAALTLPTTRIAAAVTPGARR